MCLQTGILGVRHLSCSNIASKINVTPKGVRKTAVNCSTL